MDCFTVEVINYVKGAKPFAGIEHIAHKVSRPNLVGAWRYQQGLFDPLRQSLLGPALLVQLKVTVNAVNPFVVPAMTIAP